MTIRLMPNSIYLLDLYGNSGQLKKDLKQEIKIIYITYILKNIDFGMKNNRTIEKQKQ